MLSPSDITTYQRTSNAAAGYCAQCEEASILKRKLNHISDHKELLESIDYNPETGEFSRKKSSKCGKGCIGDKVGTISVQGYLRIRFKGVIYPAHRLAWAYVYGKCEAEEIDHINGDKLDNRIANLRVASRSENMTNIGRRNQNTTGYKGVSKVTGAKASWTARITHLGKTITIGSFDSPEKAHEAYCKKSKELHGEFSNLDNNPSFLKKSSRTPRCNECANEAYVETDPHGVMHDEEAEKAVQES